MSHVPLRRSLPVALVMVATAAATIATAPALTLDGSSGPVEVTLGAEAPTVTRHIRVHLQTHDAHTPAEVGASLFVELYQEAPPESADAGAPDGGSAGEDAGVMDAGPQPATGPRLLAVLKGPDGQVLGSSEVPIGPEELGFVDAPALAGCTARECEGTFTLELSLAAEPPSSPATLTVTARVRTNLDPDEGQLTVEFVE